MSHTMEIGNVKRELKAARARTAQNRLQHQTNIRRMQMKMASIKRQTKNVKTKVHEYIRVLVILQSPTPPASAVLKSQGLFCHVIHQMAAQARLVEMTKSQCTDLIRSVRQNMIDIEDECIGIETIMLNEIALLREEIHEKEARELNILDSQQREITEVRMQLNLDREDESSILEPDPQQLVNELPVSLGREFNRSLSKSFSKISVFFSPKTRTESVSPEDNSNEEPVSHFFDSFSDLKLELCQQPLSTTPQKKDDRHIESFFHAMTNSLRLEKSLPSQWTATPPIA